MARLILETGGGRRETRISGPVTIGRSPSATCPVDHKTLSREHTQVYGQGGRYFVKDLESKNGTYLNGQLIRQPEALKHGDRIKVGPSVVFMIVFDPEDVVSTSAPTQPARPVTHAPAPRAREEAPSSGGGAAAAAARFFATLIAIGVFVVGSWFAKQLFISLVLPRIPQ